MRIKLASWYGDKAPGEEIEVDEVTAKALRRDGRVAAPAEETAQEKEAPSKTAEEPAQPEPEPEPETGRRKR